MGMWGGEFIGTRITVLVYSGCEVYQTGLGGRKIGYGRASSKVKKKSIKGRKRETGYRDSERRQGGEKTKKITYCFKVARIPQNPKMRTTFNL